MKKIVIALLGLGALVGISLMIINSRDGASVASSPTPLITPSPSPTPSPTLKPTLKPTPAATITPKPTATGTVLLNVPYIVQAPFGNWSDPKEENGCEEASSLMAVYWATGKTLTTAIALNEIVAISDWEQVTYGQYIDTSAQDTTDRIIKGYLKYPKASVVFGITANSIIAELRAGHVVIVPVNGQMIGNPNYKSPGPLEHMIVIKGYDPATDEFITNDPGTRKGESYRYRTGVLFTAIRNYLTGGDHKHRADAQKVMIVVSK